MRRGFTLVEVLVAIMILTVVVTTSLGVFLERNKRLEQARETIAAYQVLANEAEYRKRMPFSTLESQPTGFVSDTSLLEPLAPYTASVIARETQPGVKNVLMTIRWRGGQRNAKLELVRADTAGTVLW
jgi:prepilin-type N-terminal cleavage/methylation domain-containing protein